MITKSQVMDAIRYLPDDATIGDAIEHLQEIERSLQSDAQAGVRSTNGITNEAAKRRFQPMTRDELAASIQRLPEGATVVDAIERLEFIKLIEEHISEAEAQPEKLIPQEEAKRRFAQWLQ
jgi:hypothetical protein